MPYDVGVVFTTSKRLPPQGQQDPGIKLKYNVKPGRTFSGSYIIDHHLTTKDQYLLMALLDYQQSIFTLNKQEANYHLLGLKPHQQKRYDFATWPLSKGFHDYTMIAFRDPFNPSLDNKSRLMTDTKFYLPQRANLLVGKEASPSLKINAKGERVKGNKDFDTIFIKKNKNNELKNWLKEEVLSGRKINFYIHVGNASSKTKTFAVMVFLDYKQIPANPGQPLVLFGKLGPKERIIIPASIIAPKDKGVHELFVLRAVNPFAKQSDGKNKPIDDRIDSTVRTAIIVK